MCVCVHVFCLIISSEICVTVPSGKRKWHTLNTMGFIFVKWNQGSLDMNEIESCYFFVHLLSVKWKDISLSQTSLGPQIVPNPTKLDCSPHLLLSLPSRTWLHCEISLCSNNLLLTSMIIDYSPLTITLGVNPKVSVIYFTLYSIHTCI